MKHHALHPPPQGGSGDLFLEALRRKAFESCSTADMGIYLHYLQDTFSHRGYTDPEWGHAKAGHTVDKTATDVSKAYRMATATLDALIEWSRSCKECCASYSFEGSNTLGRADIGVLFNFLKAPGGGFKSEIGDNDLARKRNLLGLQPR